MIYCEVCQRDFSDRDYYPHLNGDQHRDNLAEVPEAVIIDYDGSVFMTPPPSPPDDAEDEPFAFDDEYVPQFFGPNSPVFDQLVLREEPQLEPAPRSPTMDEPIETAVSSAPWRYYNREWLLEGMGDHANEDDESDEDDEPSIRFFD